MEGFEGGWGMFDGAFTLFLLMLRMFHPLPFRCDGSDGRVAASYPADPGSNPAISSSYEIASQKEKSFFDFSHD